MLNTNYIRKKSLYGLSIADLAFRGCYRFDSINFDNIMLTTFSKPFDSYPAVEFAESSSIVERRISVSTEPEEPQGLWKVSDGFPKGVKLFYNIAVKDEAGNWSETRHFPFFCDSQPPELIRVLWSRTSVKFYFTDITEIDKQSFLVSLGGRTYQGNKIRWSSSNAVINFGITPPKKAVLTISDKFGNTARYRIVGQKIIALNKTEEL